MSTRTTLAASTLLASVLLLPLQGPRATATAERSRPILPAAANGETLALATLDPFVVVVGATPTQRQRLDVALARFADAGLALPDLEVVFDDSAEACGGAKGLFQHSRDPWRVAICTDLDPVYEHELAHAWAEATLTDEKRSEFMVLLGYEVWSDHSRPWNERGTEAAALIIQQGLNGLPLPRTLNSDARLRLDAFELLTGFPDPRLQDVMRPHQAELRPQAEDSNVRPSGLHALTLARSGPVLMSTERGTDISVMPSIT